MKPRRLQSDTSLSMSGTASSVFSSRMSSSRQCRAVHRWFATQHAHTDFLVTQPRGAVPGGSLDATRSAVFQRQSPQLRFLEWFIGRHNRAKKTGWGVSTPSPF